MWSAFHQSARLPVPEYVVPELSQVSVSRTGIWLRASQLRLCSQIGRAGSARDDTKLLDVNPTIVTSSSKYVAAVHQARECEP